MKNKITIYYNIFFSIVLVILILLIIHIQIPFYGWFFINLAGFIGLVLPFYFWSLEHKKFKDRFGKEKGNQITQTFGIISSICFFCFWIGIWISPQPIFIIPLFQEFYFFIPIFNIRISLIHFCLSLPLLIFGSLIPFKALKSMSAEIAETHRPEKIIDYGIYSYIRHPQYLGGILAHIGISILLSAFYSLISSPIIIFIIYIEIRKEEKELTIDFGDVYNNYRKKVSMFIPFKIRKISENKNPYKEELN
ncbi:MAG: isoprenylcysteine carboxylmethyltransferase family protein [Candidatus Lokiarchaeota archaeon]|nr:isoprenylcysteine carboxylmethyltransferase family protein [Candidatus Lokiarchaeota archaeon]